MAILTDYVALEPREAAALDIATFDARKYGAWAVQSKGIFDVELAALEGILTGADPMEILSVAADHEPRTANDGEIIFSAVRPTLTAALAEHAGTDWLPLATSWAATEELSDADPRYLARLLKALSDLVVRGRSEGRVLYLWVSV